MKHICRVAVMSQHVFIRKASVLSEEESCDGRKPSDSSALGTLRLCEKLQTSGTMLLVMFYSARYFFELIWCHLILPVVPHEAVAEVSEEETYRRARLL